MFGVKNEFGVNAESFDGGFKQSAVEIWEFSLDWRVLVWPLN